MLEWDADNCCFRPTNLLTINEVDLVEAPTWYEVPEHPWSIEIPTKELIIKTRNKIDGIKRKSYLRQCQKQYKERGRAGQRVKYAIKKGQLIRPTHCSHCNKECKPDGHHPDYEKPLEVIWLCRKCHKDLHKGRITLTPPLQGGN
jgi:hypothetical protein